MSDSDGEFKASRRPQSIVAQAFSTELDSLFNMDSEVDHLSQTVDQKKQMVLKQNHELQALQNRIREAEERLKAQQSSQPDKVGLGNVPGDRSNSKRDYRSAGEANNYNNELKHARSWQASLRSNAMASDQRSTVSSTSDATTPNDRYPQVARMDERRRFAGMRS